MNMLLVFPFEKEIYRRADIPATFVGHPLAGIIPDTPDVEGARAQFGLTGTTRPVLCVMPGSRNAELEGCGAIFLDAVNRLVKRIGEVEILVPLLNEEAVGKFTMMLKSYPQLEHLVRTGIGTSHRMIEAADAVLVASGTAALECALYKKPMVVGYKMPGLTGLLMEKKGLIDCVSLPNILLGEKVVPEFLQFFCEPDQISWALQDALLDEANRARLFERFSALHASLKADTANLAADVIMSLAK